MVNPMASEPTICPFCCGESLGPVRSNEELSLSAGELEACSVLAYRCARGHVFLIPNDVSLLEATAVQILVQVTTYGRWLLSSLQDASHYWAAASPKRRLFFALCTAEPGLKSASELPITHLCGIRSARHQGRRSDAGSSVRQNVN
jgi:hypothetical protein